MAIIINECRYTLRRKLGCDHEKLTACAIQDPQNPSSGDEMMEAVKALCVSHTTKASSTQQAVTPQRRQSQTPNRVRQQQQQQNRMSVSQMASMPFSYAITEQGVFKDKALLQELNKMGLYYSRKNEGGDGLWHSMQDVTDALASTGIAFELKDSEESEGGYDDDNIPF